MIIIESGALVTNEDSSSQGEPALSEESLPFLLPSGVPSLAASELQQSTPEQGADDLPGSKYILPKIGASRT